MMFGLWGLYSMEELLEKLNKLDIQGLLIAALVPYIVFMVVLFWCAHMGCVPYEVYEWPPQGKAVLQQSEKMSIRCMSGKTG